jgi:hemolysin type calcium-binding protein
MAVLSPPSISRIERKVRRLIRAEENMRRIGRLFMPTALVAGVMISPLLTASPASAAFVGKRAVMAVAGHRTGAKGSDIWLLSSTGARLDNVTRGFSPAVNAPTFSPEGGPHIAFVAHGDIFAVDRLSPGGGHRVHRVTSGPDRDAQPAWDVTGGKVVFARTPRGGGPRLLIANLSGTKVQALDYPRGSQTAIRGSDPAWAPYQTEIAYVRSTSNGPQIWVASGDGRIAPRYLTDGAAPNWSPLGDQIAFIRGGNLYVVSSSGGSPKSVDLHLNAPGDRNPAWSPDPGGVITFDRGTGIIYSVDPDVLVPRAHALRNTGRWYHADWQPVCNITGRNGNNVLHGTSKPELICAHKGNDTIYAGGGGDRIYAGGGNDRIYLGGGDDFVEGGLGSDYIRGGAGNDHIEGGPSNDRIVDRGSSSGADVLKGEGGGDVILADDGVRGNDKVDAGPDTDTCTVDNRTSVAPGDFVWQCERVRVP